MLFARTYIYTYSTAVISLLAVFLLGQRRDVVLRQSTLRISIIRRRVILDALYRRACFAVEWINTRAILLTVRAAA